LTIISVALSLVLVASCEEDVTSLPDNYVAAVGEYKLYADDMIGEIPKGLSEADSLRYSEQYIDSWVKEHVLLHKAEELLPDDAKNVEKQLQKYKNSLLMYAYEKQYVKQRLDTLIPMEDIETFYNNNIEDFTLRDYIVKAVYSKYTLLTPGLEDMSQWYKLNTEDDWTSYKAFTQMYAVDVQLDTTQWLYFNDVLDKIPLDDLNKTSFIKYKKRTKFEDGQFMYYLNILDYKLKNEASPIEFEKDKIKGILLNQRMNELRKQLKEELYKDALKSDLIRMGN
jgi:hypothetical protein